MKLRKKSKLQGEQEKEQTQKMPTEGMEDYSIEELEEQIKSHKTKMRRRTIIGTAAVILALIGVYLVIQLQTYTSVRTIDVYRSENSGNSSYKEFADGVLKYSRDGISFLNRKGEEEWNQSYQIQNPVITVYGESAAVADKGGNSIEVFTKEGLKGEIETTRPIEKIAVSSQGIVAAILKDDASPQIICYDAAGNVLAELSASLTGTGYPLNISLSDDGTILLVSYLVIQNGKASTNVYYYNFGEGGKEADNYEIVTDNYEDMTAPSAFFLDQETSVIVGNNRLLIYKGKETPKLAQTVELEKEIKSVFYSTRYIGLILKNEGEEGNELCLYNKNGKKVLSENFSGDYSNVKICGSQVIMYEVKKCSVFTRNGIKKFDGELNETIQEMFPILGVNKYIVMNANGMEVVRFVK